MPDIYLRGVEERVWESYLRFPVLQQRESQKQDSSSSEKKKKKWKGEELRRKSNPLPLEKQQDTSQFSWLLFPLGFSERSLFKRSAFCELFGLFLGIAALLCSGLLEALLRWLRYWLEAFSTLLQGGAIGQPFLPRLFGVRAAPTQLRYIELLSSASDTLTPHWMALYSMPITFLPVRLLMK